VSGRFALCALLLGALSGFAAVSTASAHDARPVSINAAEQAEGIYRVVVRAPPTLEPGTAPSVVWPAVCDVREAAAFAREPGGTSLVACPGGLEGQTISLDYPVYNPSLTTLIRLETAEGFVHTAVLPPDLLAWTVPEDPGWAAVARDYVMLGFRHIWEGPDHLMFVAGLMLLARRPRRILLAVTGFTAAHSITLSLAALGLVRVPVPPVEAMIALSILFLAAEIARGDEGSFSRRHPVALSFVFGLLHGFGFASALSEIGLPRGELAVGLVGFNLGVELGQLAFIAAAGVLALMWIRASGTLFSGWSPASALRRRAVTIAAYGLGAPAALWFLERSAQAIAG
jgi:hydrogenase/urease accessory protein HupE